MKMKEIELMQWIVFEINFFFKTSKCSNTLENVCEKMLEVGFSHTDIVFEKMLEVGFYIRKWLLGKQKMKKERRKRKKKYYSYFYQNLVNRVPNLSKLEKWVRD